MASYPAALFEEDAAYNRKILYWPVNDLWTVLGGALVSAGQTGNDDAFAEEVGCWPGDEPAAACWLTSGS